MAKSDYTIYTFSDRGPDTPLARSLQQHGAECVTLAPSVGKWRFTHKIHLALAAVRNESRPYVMIADAFDVLFLAHPDEVLRRFLAMNHPLLLNADKRLWPRSHPSDMQRKEYYDSLSTSPFRYLNSGCYVGETQFVVEFLQAARDAPAHPRRPHDDQGKIHKEFYERGARLDCRCEVFQVLNRVRDHEIERPGELDLHDLVFDTWPIVVHANKRGRTNVFAELKRNMFGEPIHG